MILKVLRITLAAICFALISLLFLDFTGVLHIWFGWLAKIQFLPALLAMNFGVVISLIVLTLIFGRVYCSIICPLGVLQDIVSWGAGKRKKNRFSYSPAKSKIRYGVLLLFVILMAAGLNSIAILIAPYSAYGRIASAIFAPIYQIANNVLAYFAERFNSYAFYSTDVWLKSIPVLVIAIISLLVLSVLSWRNGRTYCNTICPVGSILGFFSKYAWFKPHIDTSKCNGCTLCARNCKASCINAKEHTIDYSRCIGCMDCIVKCNQRAITFSHNKKLKNIEVDNNENTVSRRKFLSVVSALIVASTIKAEDKKFDGGLAVIEDKKIPRRDTPIKPAGSNSLRHFSAHCTGCQLCVSACPNGVLRPSSSLDTFMQPEVSFERGYCRPECTKCSEVCPNGAIRLISEAEKSSIQIGHAVWIKKNCLPISDGVNCDNCARHCPVGAITMIPIDSDDESLKFPMINTERCIGCGACENLCPTRPFSAIYVEGHKVHRNI